MLNTPSDDRGQDKLAIDVVDGFCEPLEGIYELIESIYQSSNSFCSEFAELYPDLASFREHIHQLSERPGSLFLIAREADTLLGYLFVEPRSASKLRHTADLNMGMKETARGRGVGRILVEKATDVIESQRIIEIVYLMVRADNPAGVQLYTSKGFEILATLQRDTKIGVDYFDGLLMRRFSHWVRK